MLVFGIGWASDLRGGLAHPWRLGVRLGRLGGRAWRMSGRGRSGGVVLWWMELV